MIINLIKSWFQKPREPTQQERTIKLIEYLKNQDYGFVYSSDLSMFELTVVKKNISDYVTYLRRINNQLISEEEIYSRNINLKHMSMKLPLWFIIDGSFIEPSEHMQLLLNEIQVFMETYYKYDNMLNRNYTQENNLRMVGGICGDLLTLMKEIQNVCYKSIHLGSESTN